MASGSATREAITKSQLEDFKIPVPPLAEQADFVVQVEAIETKIAEAQRIIDQAPAQNRPF
ncbi:MAG: restriction endonuclease subunit S [Moraxellaceae bacterium]|nr:restriction endonuclease subunit S [Moraxellaceae bacterium]